MALSSASIMRVIYDILAKSYADVINELERNTGKKYKTLNIIGGSQDSLLNEMTAKKGYNGTYRSHGDSKTKGNFRINSLLAG